MSDNTANNKRIAKNTIYLSIRMVIVLTLNLFTTRIVLQALGVVDYGVYNVVGGFVALFAFLNTSMSNGIQRYFNYEYGKNGEEGANNVYNTSIYIQAALALLVAVLVEAVGLWYLHNKMVIPDDRMVAAEWVFQFSVVTFILGIMQAPFSAAVTAHQRFDFYAIISVLDALLKLGIVYLLFLISSDRLVVYGILIASISLINIVIFYWYCKRNFSEIKFKPNFDRQLFKSMLGFSGWNLFGSFSGVMVNQGINLVLNFFFGPVVNAARGVAVQINGAVHSFVNNISVPVRPQVTQSYAKGDVSRTMRLTYSISKISCAIVIMLAVPASIEIDYLLNLWLGDNVPEHTSTFTILVLITSLVTNLNWATSGVVHATGIMRDYQVWGSLVKMASVPIAFFLLKVYDIPEIALLIVLLCEIIAHIIGLFIVKRIVGMSVVDYCVKVALPIGVVLLICIVTIYPLHLLIEEGFFRVIIVSFCSLVITSITTYYFGFDKNERILVKQMAGTLINKFKKKS